MPDASDPTPPLSILVLNAVSPRLHAFVLALGAGRRRVALQYHHDERTALELAVRLNETGALVSPLDAGVTTAVERVVEDFARVDILLCEADDLRCGRLRADISAAMPALRESQPCGHVILVSSQGPSDEMRADLVSLAEATRTRRGRPAFHVLDDAGDLDAVLATRGGEHLWL